MMSSHSDPEALEAAPRQEGSPLLEAAPRQEGSPLLEAAPRQEGSPLPKGDAGALAVAAALFRGLGDPSRLAILSHLMLGEHKVRDLTEHLGLAQSTVSEHLRCLLDCGLVRVRAQGRASVYSLAWEPQVRQLLMDAEVLLATTGDAVLLCPRYGREAQA